MGNILEPFTEKESDLQKKLLDSSDFIRVYVNKTTKVLSERRTSKKKAHFTTTNINKKLRKKATSLQIVHENNLPFLIGYVYSNKQNEFKVKVHLIRAPIEETDREALQIESPEMKRLHHIALYVPPNSKDSYKSFPTDIYKVLENQKTVLTQKLTIELLKLHDEKVKEIRKSLSEENPDGVTEGAAEGTTEGAAEGFTARGNTAHENTTGVNRQRMLWAADGSIQLIR